MASSDILRFQVVDAGRNWYMPKRGTPQSAGLDMYSDSESPIIIKGHETITVNTNLRVYIPDGCYGRVAPRSSLAKMGALVNAGVIDSDYRGEIKIVIHNLWPAPMYLYGDQPVAQLIIEKLRNFPQGHMVIHDPKMIDSTVRGEGGFGSTNALTLDNQRQVINNRYHAKFGLCRGPCPQGGHYSKANYLLHLQEAEITGYYCDPEVCWTCSIGKAETPNEAKRAKKDTLVGIETNPGPQVTSCDSCGKVLNGLQVTLIRPFADTVYFCNLQCMVNCLFQRKQVTTPQPLLIGVELNPGPATKIIRASDNKIWTKAVDPMGWQPWYCTSSRAWKAQMRKETERAIKRANKGEGTKNELKTVELLW